MEYINRYKEQFKNDVFEEIIEEGYQYIKPLLQQSKEVDKNNLKEQIDAYKRVIDYLNKESQKELNVESTFLSNKSDENLINILNDASNYLQEHISTRIERYLKIIEVSEIYLKYLDQKSTEESLNLLFENDFMKVLELEDTSQRKNFMSITFRMYLRLQGTEDNKVDFIMNLLNNGIEYNKQVKTLYKEDTKPVIIHNVASFLKILKQDDKIYYRGHSSSDFKMIPSVYRDGLFYFEDDLVKEMMLKLPEDFPATATHYEKLMKMQHYGIPTKLLDVTTNPLVALFMAVDGNPHLDGEVLMIENTSFEECYPSSDKVKILTSVPFLTFGTKIILAYLLDDARVTDEMFNLLARPLLHEIKHEMPAFEARMEKTDLLNHLFILGPKSNKRIYAQSGHFIISPLTLKFFSSTPVKFVESDTGKPLKVIIPAKDKERIINELKLLNISKSTMYPEIEHVAKEIKHQYL